MVYLYDCVVLAPLQSLRRWHGKRAPPNPATETSCPFLSTLVPDSRCYLGMSRFEHLTRLVTKNAFESDLAVLCCMGP